MNIFYLDHNPQKCAQYHVDRHIVKMPLETAQLLCTTLNLHGATSPYKSTHKNHPCRLWAHNRENYEYLCLLGLCLCEEYSYRYGKTHACQEVIKFCRGHIDKITSGLFADPPQCMPGEYKRENTIEAYRAYYKSKKYDNSGNPMDLWKNRERPHWYEI